MGLMINGRVIHEYTKQKLEFKELVWCKEVMRQLIQTKDYAAEHYILMMFVDLACGSTLQEVKEELDVIDPDRTEEDQEAMDSAWEDEQGPDELEDLEESYKFYKQDMGRHGPWNE